MLKKKKRRKIDTSGKFLVDGHIVRQCGKLQCVRGNTVFQFDPTQPCRNSTMNDHLACLVNQKVDDNLLS